MFINKLYKLREDLSKHKKSPEIVLYESVCARLNNSLISYTKELSDQVNYLKNRESFNVLRKYVRK